MFRASFNLVTRFGLFGTIKDDSLLISTLYHREFYRAIVIATETSSKMASTLSQKRLTIFAKNLKILNTS